MTQEEKARAYDAALERAKPLYEWAKKDDNPMWSTYEYLFPQIAESEDERIRKWLIKTVRLIGVDKDICADQETMDKAIAYLEKQKEQKPVEWSEEDETSIAVKNPEAYKIGFADGEAYAKEQGVPAEWSEEDEKMINHIIEALPRWANGLITILPSQAEEYVKRLKSLRPSWKPSEEQMRALLNAEGFLRAGLQHDSVKTIAELYEQLKKLKEDKI